VTLPGQTPTDGFAHHLLIRRSTDKKHLAGGRIDYEYAYFLIHAPGGAPLAEAVRQAGVRWKIEENNKTAKQVTGLGQYQVRRWTSWHRHVTCAMLALAFLTVQRARHLDAESAASGAEHGDDLGKAPTAETRNGCP
jgi:SRSO17 transposase